MVQRLQSQQPHSTNQQRHSKGKQPGRQARGAGLRCPDYGGSLHQVSTRWGAEWHCARCGWYQD